MVGRAGRRWRPVVVAALVASAVALGGCGRDGAGTIPVSGDPNGTGVATDAASASRGPIGVSEFPAAAREPGPELSGETLSGGTYSLADDLGRVVVVNSWASWCPPCREEMPELRAVHDAADPADVAFIGIDVNDDPAKARAFATEVGIGWDSLIDRDGRMLASLPDVPPKSLPSTLVLDRQGRVAAAVVGPVPPGVLGPIVERVAAEPA